MKLRNLLNCELEVSEKSRSPIGIAHSSSFTLDPIRLLLSFLFPTSDYSHFGHQTFTPSVSFPSMHPHPPTTTHTTPALTNPPSNKGLFHKRLVSSNHLRSLDCVPAFDPLIIYCMLLSDLSCHHLAINHTTWMSSCLPSKVITSFRQTSKWSGCRFSTQIFRASRVRLEGPWRTVAKTSGTFENRWWNKMKRESVMVSSAGLADMKDRKPDRRQCFGRKLLHWIPRVSHGHQVTFTLMLRKITIALRLVQESWSSISV